jgi:polyphenol oxidase
MQDSLSEALKRNDWPLEKHGELTLVLSPLLKRVDFLVQAFTTRLGGKSPSPLDSFNLGRHGLSEESRLDAMQNRRRLCQVFSLDAGMLAVPGQHHSTNIQVLEKQLQPGPFYFPGIDAIATAAREQPVLLHFADCVPVMLVDRVKKQVCVVHAGWRGTAGGIVSKSVRLMEEQLGSRPADIVAAVGPAIGPCCYETGEEVVKGLAGTVSDPSLLISYRDGRPFPDLKAFNAMQLLEAGVHDIDVASWCTACHPELFYSHRQSGGKTGRQGVLACLI